MKYEEGTVLYTYNNRTGKPTEHKIVAIKYEFDKTVGGKKYVTQAELDKMVSAKQIADNLDTYKKQRIKLLEKELGLSLEVKSK